MFIRLIQTLLILSFSLSAYAEDAKTLYQEAKGLYSERYEKENINTALNLLDQAAEESLDPLLSYKIEILKSRFYYANSRHLEGEDNLKATYQSAMDAAKVAEDLALIDLAQEYSEAYYYYGIALARWAEINGIRESLSRRKELQASMETAANLSTLENKSGKTIDSYGPDRVLGRLYHKLPAIFGGSKTKALEHLQIAHNKGSELALNTLYLTELLLDKFRGKKNEACNILADLLSRDPESFDPKKPVETKEDLENAKALQEENCN